jgi:hypothetical protein
VPNKLQVASLQAVLKKLYPSDEIKRLVYEDSPFLGMVEKWEQFFGDTFQEALIHGPGAGRATTIANAQSAYTPHKSKAFAISRVSDYAVAFLKGEAIEASENDTGALVRGLKTESDMAIHRLKRSMSHDVFGDGSGAIGKIAAGGIAGNVVTLESTEDIVHFEEGQVIQANPNKTGNAGSMRAGTMIVTAVDRDLGKVTFGGGLVAALAAADFLYPNGDYDGKLKGMGAWLPDTAPAGGDNFFGVDRSSDPVRLAGIRYDATGGEAIVDALQGISTRIGREGGRPQHAWANPTRMLQLTKELGGKVMFEDYVSDQKIGYRGVQVQTDKVNLTVYSDPNVPVNRIFVTDPRTWKLRTLKAAPRILNLDSLSMVRVSDDDAYEIRFGYYGQLSCRAPGWNGVIKLA